MKSLQAYTCTYSYQFKYLKLSINTIFTFTSTNQSYNIADNTQYILNINDIGH